MGKLFVIDGTDGSGKQTQFQKLQERLDKEGIEYKTVSFPNYDSPSSSLVKMYLSGEFGENAKDISPYIASTFYAADRYATYKKDLEEYYNNGGLILADRYTTSNMGLLTMMFLYIMPINMAILKKWPVSLRVYLELR